jgi:hypothetical protein
VVAENVTKLASSGKNVSSVVSEIREERKEFQCLTKGEVSQHPLANSLQSKLEQYQQMNFSGKSGVTTRIVMTKTSDSNDLVVNTYAEKIDGLNQISGYWKSTWTISSDTATSTTTPDDSTCIMLGRVQVHSCAYEEGNSQCQVDKMFPTIKVSKLAFKKDDEPTLLQGIMKQIMTWEMDVLNLLKTMNEGGTGDHLRAIRRVLPITKTKMKWDVVAQRSVKTLITTAPQAKSKVNYGS